MKYVALFTALGLASAAFLAVGAPEGRGDDRLLLEYVSEVSDVVVGDVVVTSGIDGIYPKGFVIGRVESIGWTLPIDDTHYRIYTAARVAEKGVFLPKGAGAPTNRKRWQDMSPEERREFPGDWEAQIGQGPITLHSEERLASSDKGIVLLRRLLRKQVDELAAGRDPIGVSFDPAAPPKLPSIWNGGCASNRLA